MYITYIYVYIYDICICNIYIYIYIYIYIRDYFILFILGYNIFSDLKIESKIEKVIFSM